MKDVSMRKDELLKKLEENRTNHRSTFEQAMDVYGKAITELLENLKQRALEGKVIPQRALYELPMPEDHTREYDVAIEMLHHDTRDVLVLSNQDFQRYHMNQWEWTQSFTANTESYVTGSY